MDVALDLVVSVFGWLWAHAGTIFVVFAGVAIANLAMNAREQCDRQGVELVDLRKRIESIEAALIHHRDFTHRDDA